MDSTIGPDTRKYVLYPLAVIMIAISFHTLIPLVVPEAGVFDLRFPGSFMYWVLIFAGTLVACTGIFMQQKKIAFIGIIVFGCAPIVNFFIMAFNLMHKNPDLIKLDIKFTQVFLTTIISIPFLTAFFVLFPYRKYFFTQEESTRGILSLLGTIFLSHGLYSVGLILFRIGFSDFEPLLLPAISILVGIGIWSRERFLGIFGFLVWLIFLARAILPLFRYIPSIRDLSVVKKILFFEVEGNFLFYLAIFFMVLIVFRRQFRFSKLILAFMKNISASSAGVKKECSSCGRSVPSRSSVGDRCPYCGAYWSYEKMKR